MKVLILAGGKGTRISEEGEIKPKPMLDIGGKPILWHIMKSYSHYGVNEFIILLGYKGYMIKEYFFNYYLHQSDITINLENNDLEVHNNSSEPWKVTLVDTGEETMTGGRIKRAKEFIGEDTFMLTYGDGVSNIDINALYDSHQKSGKKLTMTSIQPEGRFGALKIDEDDLVTDFYEKPKGDGGWINGGYFVCEPSILDYIENDTTIFEREPLERLAKERDLSTYKHDGFWQCMDTQRDKALLHDMWETKKAKWKVW